MGEQERARRSAGERLPAEWLDGAREAFRLARFRAAAQQLDEAEVALRRLPEPAALLRARIFVKREPAAALGYLAARSSLLRSRTGKAESEMLQGVAFARLGDPKAASARFAVAKRFAALDPPLLDELAYQRGAALWIERKLEQSGRAIEHLLIRDDPVAIEARVLAGAIEGSRGNLFGQGAILLDASQALARTSRPHSLHRAVVASQIAYLARELPSAALRTAAIAQFELIPWTEDLAEYRFTMARAIGWCHALDGDYFNAFRHLKAATAAAPSAAWTVMATADRAYLASVLGERRWAEQELNDAREIAETVNWAAHDGEERFALAILAELFASRDAALALSYLARYREIGSRFARTLSSSDDRRVAAMEAYSFGIVHRALGNAGEAASLLREAWTTYEAIGYDWRAGRAAKALYEITGDERWQARAGEKLVAYPHSWLVVDNPASTVLQARGTEALTPAQREVFKLLLRGLGAREIGRELGRSENTVRNHTKAIFKALGVRSRAALLARARDAAT